MGSLEQVESRPKRHYGRRLSRQRALARKFNRRVAQPVRDNAPRPPRIHTYRCDSILVDDAARVAAEAKTNAYVADLAARHSIERGDSLSDEDAVWRLPLLDRPGGKRLDELLGVGDHVVLAGVMSCQGPKDLLTLLRVWQPRCVTVHVPTLKLSIATGSEDGKLAISVLEAFAALKFAERSAQRFRNGCPAAGAGLRVPRPNPAGLEDRRRGQGLQAAGSREHRGMHERAGHPRRDRAPPRRTRVVVAGD